MADRATRHRSMAEERIQATREMTRANVEGRKPEASPFDNGPITYFSPQAGHDIVSEGGSVFGHEGTLRELSILWRRYPDFGIETYELFPGEAGWVQILHWSGTGPEGDAVRAQEANVFSTDDDFNVVRIEYYCESKQWLDLAAAALGEDPASFDLKRYFRVVQSL